MALQYVHTYDAVFSLTNWPTILTLSY